jgi:suppressor for copper-sensitivity B
VEAISWKPFDEARIAHYVAEGKTVLVDVTADWCITCKWNKQAVLETSPVMDWLQREDVIAMQADWTRPNPDIAGYLEWFGRYGIPFNTVYGPTAPQGIPLPELLSSAAVLDAARKADTSADMASYPEDIE